VARLRIRRDALLVAALAVVAAAAVADTVVRGSGEPATEARTRAEPRTPAPSPAEPDRPAGTLLYSDAACVVHELDLASRETVAVAPTAEGCYGLWAPAGGERFAYAVEAREEAGTRRVVLRVRERSGSSFDAGPFEARSSSVVTASDGTVGWCRPVRGGELYAWRTADLVRLPACPATLTPRGIPVYMAGRQILFGRAAVRTFDGPAPFLSVGGDGSLALVTRGRASLYRPADNPRPVGTVLVPPFRDRPAFAPDNCAVALPSQPRDDPPSIRVRGLPCQGAPRPWTFPGFDAAWSPDGRWIAVTDGVAVRVYSVGDPARDPIGLPVRAGHIAWTSR
jgi:hypothetical protein